MPKSVGKIPSTSQNLDLEKNFKTNNPLITGQKIPLKHTTGHLRPRGKAGGVSLEIKRDKLAVWRSQKPCAWTAQEGVQKRPVSNSAFHLGLILRLVASLAKCSGSGLAQSQSPAKPGTAEGCLFQLWAFKISLSKHKINTHWGAQTSLAAHNKVLSLCKSDFGDPGQRVQLTWP